MIEDDPWAQAPKPTASKPADRSLRTPIITVAVGLFVLGVLASVMVTLWGPGLSALSPAPQVKVTAQPVWRPAEGPLVRGVTLGSEAPEQLAFSNDGRQLAWSTFDANRGVPVVMTVGVGDAGFTAPQELDAPPAWLTEPAPSVVSAAVDSDVVTLRWIEGPRRGQSAGVVDVKGLLGLVEARTPSVVTFGPITRLAVVARLPDGGQYSVHVFDVSELIDPPPPTPVLTPGQ